MGGYAAHDGVDARVSSVWRKLTPKTATIAQSSNGRTTDFESVNLGSNPSGATVRKISKLRNDEFQDAQVYESAEGVQVVLLPNTSL